jgi:hypothetical protein
MNRHPANALSCGIAESIALPGIAPPMHAGKGPRITNLLTSG